MTAPRDSLDMKIRWLITHQYMPCYRPVLDEIKILCKGRTRLYPLQWKVLEHSGNLESLYEIAHRNPSKVHPLVHFVDGELLPANVAM